ncbi:hypothetical protein NL676_023110 [Syzygium grande]|nr:hypothetical protein NL676_023110 [Syzygium grande]
MNSGEVANHGDGDDVDVDDDIIDTLALLLPLQDGGGGGEEEEEEDALAGRHHPPQPPRRPRLRPRRGPPLPDPRRPPPPPRQRRLSVLELGSGTGLVGIAAAVALGADVTVTDLPHVVPNLQFSVDANAAALAAGAGGGGAVRVAPLRWGEAEDVGALGEEYDVILASDVVYYDHLYDPLLETLRWLFERSERREEMVFVMAHLRRWKKDSAFFRKARKAFDVEAIHADEPRHGSRVGVAVYRFDWKRKRTAKCAAPSHAVSADLTAHSI